MTAPDPVLAAAIAELGQVRKLYREHVAACPSEGCPLRESLARHAARAEAQARMLAGPAETGEMP